MTEAEQALDLVRRAADELVPQLTERLERHGLAEIEVARGELRLRVTGRPATRPAAVAATPDGTNATPPLSVAPAPVSDPGAAADPSRAPASRRAKRRLSSPALRGSPLPRPSGNRAAGISPVPAGGPPLRGGAASPGP